MRNTNIPKILNVPKHDTFFPRRLLPKDLQTALRISSENNLIETLYNLLLSVPNSRRIIPIPLSSPSPSLPPLTLTFTLTPAQ